MMLRRNISEMLARFGDKEAIRRRRDLLSLAGFLTGAALTLVILAITVIYVLGGLLGVVQMAWG